MIKQIFLRLLAALCLTGALGTLAACNTMDGAGKDIQRGGAAISREAQEHKRY
jgi:entericidin B